MFTRGRLVGVFGFAMGLLATGRLVALPEPGLEQSGFQQSKVTRIRVEGGTIEGAEPAAGVRAYLGVPFAKAPVGALRWRPPVPAAKWTGTRAATEYGAPCAQTDFGWNKVSAERGSEDCLYLNVWAPMKGERRPVMVYVHGGGNIAGSASYDLSKGTELAARGVVLVTVNYRVGVFGFLRTPELDAESGHGGSGNYGLEDQIAALEWVGRNIARFGGDPRNVTVFGQSAGAIDLGILMTSPRAQGLFARVLAESGTAIGVMPVATKGEAEGEWAPVARELGGDLTAMRARPAAEVLAIAAKTSKIENWYKRAPSVDGWVVPEMPGEVFRAGREAPVPLLLGSNVREIVLEGQATGETERMIEAQLGPEAGKRLEAVYAKDGADPLLGNMATRWMTDWNLRCATVQIAQWHAGHGFPTYVYRFDRPMPGKETAVHGTELHYLFRAFADQKETVADDAVTNLLQGYWTAFARGGDPNAGAPAVRWPRFGGAGGEYLHIGVSSVTPEVRRDPGGEACGVMMPGYVAKAP